MHDPTEAPSGDGPARRGGPRHAAHRRRGRASLAAPRRHPVRWLALGVALAAAAAGVVVGLLRDDGGRDPDTASATTAEPAGGSAATAAPPALLDWLRTELPEGGTVAAEPALRAALLRAGAEDAGLPEAPSREGDAAIPALILTETPAEGGRLLARFDRDGAAPLLLVDPAPVQATAEQRRQRETLAAAVLANPTTRTDGNTRAVLTGADVDARLLALVAGLTAREGVGLGDFPAPPGEEAGAAPARRVVVDALGGRPVPANGATTQRLVAWLEAQLAPFAPDTVEVTGDGVLIGFDYVPGPDAVVSEATS